MSPLKCIEPLAVTFVLQKRFACITTVICVWLPEMIHVHRIIYLVKADQGWKRNLNVTFILGLMNLITRDLVTYFLVSTYVVCERLSVMHKQVSVWTVNFCPNSPEHPSLEFQIRVPPPPQMKTSDLSLPKFRSEYPPKWRLQVWVDQSLDQSTPAPTPPPPLLLVGVSVSGELYLSYG